MASAYCCLQNCASFLPYCGFRVAFTVSTGTFACFSRIAAGIAGITSARRKAAAPLFASAVGFAFASVAVVSVVESQLNEDIQFVELVTCSSCFRKGFEVKLGLHAFVCFNFAGPTFLVALFVFAIELEFYQTN